MKKHIPRYPKPSAAERLHFKDGRVAVVIELGRLQKLYGIHCETKFPAQDFKLIRKGRKKLTHFNLEYTGHVPGRKYLLVGIEVPGYFDGVTKRPPVLNKDRFWVAKCLSARSHIAYEDLTAKDFRHSLENIKSAPELKRAILRRYAKSMAHMSRKQKLAMGVGITELEIIDGKRLFSKTAGKTARRAS